MLLEINIKLILSNIKKEQFIACLFNKNNINSKCFQTIDEYIIKNIIKE